MQTASSLRYYLRHCKKKGKHEPLLTSSLSCPAGINKFSEQEDAGEAEGVGERVQSSAALSTV